MKAVWIVLNRRSFYLSHIGTVRDDMGRLSISESFYTKWRRGEAGKNKIVSVVK